MVIYSKRGITLLEVIVVLIIIFIGIVVAVPNYRDRMERTRGDRAIVNIEIMVDAIKMYYIKHRDLSDFEDGGISGINAINTTLHLELRDPNFNYLAVRPDVTVIQISATRNSGIYNNDQLLYEVDPETPNGIDAWGTPEPAWPWHPE